MLSKRYDRRPGVALAREADGRTSMDFLQQLVQKRGTDEVSRRAAALAFYTFLALAPLLVVMVSILGLVYGRLGAQARIIEQAQSVVGPTAASALKTVIEHASSRGGGILGVAIGAFLVVLAAVGVFLELQTDLNVIWHVQAPTHQGIFQGMARQLTNRLLTFVALLGVGFMLLLSLLASALVAGFAHRLGNSIADPSIVLQAGESLVFLGIVTLLMAFLFRVIPNAVTPWKAVWTGSFVTALLFAIGKLAVGLYLGRSSTSSSYGAAGAFVVLLLWIYYSAQIFLLGAELTALLACRDGYRSAPEVVEHS
jgi:membrane protein